MIANKAIITATLLSGMIISVHGATTWTADADFVADEQVAGTNPNTTVPEWSYGFRDAVASSSISLFGAGDHSDALFGFPEIQGYTIDVMQTFANVSGTPIGTVNPGDLIIHPRTLIAANTYNVIRWTAPVSGTYDITAIWRDADIGDIADDGVDSHIVHNGASVFDVLVGKGETKNTAQSLTLDAGDFLDFVLGPGASGDNSNDATAFNATITLVPEPSAALLAAIAIPLVFRRRRGGAA